MSNADISPIANGLSNPRVLEYLSTTGSYTTVSKEKVDTEIAMCQSADRLTIDIINIVSEQQ